MAVVFPERTSFSDSAERPSGAAKNALHAGVGHSDDFGQAHGKAELDHSSEQLVRGGSDSASSSSQWF